MAEGHQVGILCDSSTGGAHEDALFKALLPQLSLGLIRLPIRRAISPSDLLALQASYRHIKKLQPDILHGHGAKGGLVVRLIGSKLRAEKYCVARFYSPHGGSLHYDRKRPSGQIVLRAERFLERFTDQLVFVCRYEQDVYEEKVGRPRTPARIIYNGITAAEFAPVETQASAADFLYIGMMRDLKGPDVFINALAAAEHRLGRTLSAVMVGDGPDKDRYRGMIAERGLTQRVRLYDAMPAREAFALGRIVVVPSRAEAMPYIVLEALAAGKPLIASRVGGIPEVLGGDSAALATAGDADDLARLMQDTIQDKDWQQRVMPDAQAFRARFSATSMADDMLRLYRERLAVISAKLS